MSDPIRSESSQSTGDIQTIIAVLSIKLFGRERSPKAPGAGFFCRSAIETYGAEDAGPWFKYPDQTWACELCTEDPYLSEYGAKYLLGPAGMVAIIAALRARGFDCSVDLQGSTFSVPGCWVEFTDMKLSEAFRYDCDADRLNEAIVRAAFKAVSQQEG